jgi:hypothetical protein
MDCGSCGATIQDPEAKFCSRCGHPLAGDAEATDRVDAPESSSQALPQTGRVGDSNGDFDPEGGRPPSPGRPDTEPGRHGSAAAGVVATIQDMMAVIRHAFAEGGWGPAVSAAALSFLAVLGVGAAFIGVLKIYDPSFGAGRSAPWVIVRIVISGLASLGIPVEQVGAEGAILPLGGLLLIGWVSVWASRSVVMKSTASSTSGRAVQGAKTAIPFGLMVFVAALVFRVRVPVEVGANPGVGLLVGALWGAIFGAIGGTMAGGNLRALIETPPAKYAVGIDGGRSAAIMLVTSAALACGATLVFLIVNLAAGPDVALAAGDALAIVFLLLVFGPNIVAGVLAFSIGAPITFVARSLGVRVQNEFSLLGLGGGNPDWHLYPLLLIPLSACLLGGYWARRRSADPRRSLETVGIAVCLFAVVVGALAALGGISLDRVFLGEGNLLVLRADPGTTFVLALLWAALAGVAGWKIADTQIDAPRPPVSTKT